MIIIIVFACFCVCMYVLALIGGRLNEVVQEANNGFMPVSLNTMKKVWPCDDWDGKDYQKCLELADEDHTLLIREHKLKFLSDIIPSNIYGKGFTVKFMGLLKLNTSASVQSVGDLLGNLAIVLPIVTGIACIVFIIFYT